MCQLSQPLDSPQNIFLLHSAGTLSVLVLTWAFLYYGSLGKTSSSSGHRRVAAPVTGAWQLRSPAHGSSGHRRVAAPLAPLPVRSVVDFLLLCSSLFSFLFDEDIVVEELGSLRLGVVCRIYLGYVVC
ncbi:hypothetical protein F2Q69_00033521 [Brassica cretica]|uniref:Uncharacterized protein n=1 Tax=Brassica cretica TaxID=69181 RepID=A0A8S9SC58_BRACR|nr:hypothetical protein F2Q69_00033521 [Brassica cretica]